MFNSEETHDHPYPHPFQKKKMRSRNAIYIISQFLISCHDNQSIGGTKTTMHMNIFSIIFMTSQTNNNNNNKDTAQRGSERRVGVGGGVQSPQSLFWIHLCSSFWERSRLLPLQAFTLCDIRMAAARVAYDMITTSEFDCMRACRSVE